jgi:hypothetical protein
VPALQQVIQEQHNSSQAATKTVTAEPAGSSKAPVANTGDVPSLDAPAPAQTEGADSSKSGK